MFTVDDSSMHLAATPAATAHLSALAGAQGDVTVVLTDSGAAVLSMGERPQAGSVMLGHLDEAGDITCVADNASGHNWWRTRAHIDLSEDQSMTYDVSSLTEAELFAVLAAGPLPRV